MHKSAASALMALALIITPSLAHSWVEQMMVIAPNGSFTGSPGYARNNTMRTVPGFSDLLMVHILPGQGQPSIEERQAPSPSVSAPAAGTSTAFSDTMSILPTDPMCKKTQQTQFQSNGSPRLQAAPGANIALRYQENGHVTLPQNQPGKQANRGTVYIYGTTQPKTDEIFLDVFKQWNAAGTGGDMRGVLLATQPFDDGQCYQVNSGNISTARQSQYPHQANQLMGANLWCQNDISLPADAPSGQPYTLYWVWDWPTMPGVDPNLPNGKAEIYTTCMDIDIQGTNAKRARRDLDERQAPAAPSASAASGVDLNNYAIPKYMAQLASPGAQSAQAAQATPASPMAPTNAGQSATDAQAASGFMSYLSTAIAAEPSVGACSAVTAAPVTVTVTPPAVTVFANSEMNPNTMATVVLPTSTITVTASGIASVSVPAGTQAAVQAPAPVASSPAQAAPPSMATNSAQAAPQAASSTPASVASSPAQAPAQAQVTSSVTVFATSIIPMPSPTVQAGSQISSPVIALVTSSSSVYMASTPVQGGSQVASPSPNAVASSPAQAPAQSQPVTYSTTSLPPSIPPTVLVFAPPVTSGTPPPLTPLTSASSAASPTALIPSVASNMANEISFTGPTSAATSSVPLSVANAISFSGTASAVPIAPTHSSSYQNTVSSSGFPAPYQNTTSPSTAPRSCSMKKCAVKKRSLLLANHVHRH